MAQHKVISRVSLLAAVLAAIAPLSGLTANPPTATAKARSNVEGHYYLHGMHEVGSELLLHADGRYEWMLAYGSVDMLSNGRWTRQGNRIILTPDLIDKRQPILEAQPLLPWDERNENDRLEQIRDAQNAARYQRCRFLLNNDDGAVDAAAAPPMIVDQPRPDATTATKAYHAAIATEDRRRGEYERLAAAAMNLAQRNADAATVQTAMVSARTARLAWHDAKEDRFRTQGDMVRAELAFPDYRPPEPQLPAACQEPAWVNAHDIDPAQWVRGFAVHVGDPEILVNYSGLYVTITYDDGHQVRDTTNSGGRVVMPLRDPHRVTGVDVVLKNRYDDDPSATPIATLHVDVADRRDGMLPVILHSNVITKPAFDQMTMELDKDGSLTVIDWAPLAGNSYTR